MDRYTDTLVFHSVSRSAKGLLEDPFQSLFGLKGRATVHTGTWVFNGKCLVYSIPNEERTQLLAGPDNSYDEARSFPGWFALAKKVPEELEAQALGWLEGLDKTRIRGGINPELNPLDMRYLPREYLVAVVDCRTKGRQNRYFYPEITNMDYSKDMDPHSLEERMKRNAYENGSRFGSFVKKMPDALLRVLP